ncbi:MAG: hypothetical protein WBX49_07175, partial [Candidatus Deferrimicrobiaceae bacterium]
MPSKTKSQLITNNAAMQARLAELESRLANLHSGEGTLRESKIADHERIEHEMKASETRYRRLFE